LTIPSYVDLCKLQGDMANEKKKMDATLPLLLLVVVVVFSSAVAPQVGSFNLIHAMVDSYYCAALISHRSISHVEGLIDIY
jgi:hypothetical protein